MNYITEPGHVGFITDIIVSPPRKVIDGMRKRIRFISAYQCETDYECSGVTGRLTFRYGKVPWQWDWHKGRRYWNYDSEEEFNRIGPNASWGILHNNGRLVSAEILELFRDEYCSDAVTGFYDSAKHIWITHEKTRPDSPRVRPHPAEMVQATLAENMAAQVA